MCYVGNTNYCVCIYVFVNVYVALAVDFFCFEEIIYKTDTNGKKTKLGRPDFTNNRNLTITFATLFRVASLSTTATALTIPLLLLDFLYRIFYHLPYYILDLFMCCFFSLEWKPNNRGFLSPLFIAVVPMPVTMSAHSRYSINTNKWE